MKWGMKTSPTVNDTIPSDIHHTKKYKTPSPHSKIGKQVTELLEDILFPLLTFNN